MQTVRNPPFVYIVHIIFIYCFSHKIVSIKCSNIEMYISTIKPNHRNENQMTQKVYNVDLFFDPKTPSYGINLVNYIFLNLITAKRTAAVYSTVFHEPLNMDPVPYFALAKTRARIQSDNDTSTSESGSNLRKVTKPSLQPYETACGRWCGWTLQEVKLFDSTDWTPLSRTPPYICRYRVEVIEKLANIQTAEGWCSFALTFNFFLSSSMVFSRWK